MGPSLSQSPPAAPGVHAHRVIFIDLARALAVLFMLYGHTLDALLAPQYRVGTWFDVWQFQRGLTSSLFLMLSGFAFSIATVRHWASHLYPSRALLRRLRRFALFIALGYALHIPVPSVAELRTVPPEGWRAFWAVDVLQLIGVTFIGVQALVMLCRSPRVFMVVSLLLAAIMVVATPWLWSIEWARAFPPWLAAYFSQASGSIFPVFPWAAFVLLGAGLGQIYARWGAARLGRFANTVLLSAGAVMVGAALLARLPWSRLLWSGPSAFIPPEIILRAGVCLVGLGLMAHASVRLSRLPHVFGAVAQETLLIYFVHLCIVYGSVWNPGLAQAFGSTLSPLGTFITVIGVVGSMVVLAWVWNHWKHARPQMARRVSIAVAVVLLLRLL